MLRISVSARSRKHEVDHDLTFREFPNALRISVSARSRIPRERVQRMLTTSTLFRRSASVRSRKLLGNFVAESSQCLYCPVFRRSVSARSRKQTKIASIVFSPSFRRSASVRSLKQVLFPPF